MINKISRREPSSYKIDHTLPDSSITLQYHLAELLRNRSANQPVVIICIGTDRSTGDSLGPLVGSRLQSLIPTDDCTVYGTLDYPVHAVNLAETLVTIQRMYTNPFIIAVDACLGQLSSVGVITVSSGPLKPGAGVNKSLPEVGDIHVTGVVNVGGFMEYFVLQNTRLSVVMKMAECIAQSISETIHSISRVSPYREAHLESNYLR